MPHTIDTPEVRGRWQPADTEPTDASLRAASLARAQLAAEVAEVTQAATSALLRADAALARLREREARHA